MEIQLNMSEKDAMRVVELIDELIKERVDHAVSNRHSHEYPSTEAGIWDAQTRLTNYLTGEIK